MRHVAGAIPAIRSDLCLTSRCSKHPSRTTQLLRIALERGFRWAVPGSNRGPPACKELQAVSRGVRLALQRQIARSEPADSGLVLSLWARSGHDDGRRSTSWVRCICERRRASVRGGPATLQRGCGPSERPRGSAGFEPVCLWCARGGLDPHSRRSRVDQRISGGGRGVKRRPTGRSKASCEAGLLTPADGGASRDCTVCSCSAACCCSASYTAGAAPDSAAYERAVLGA